MTRPTIMLGIAAALTVAACERERPAPAEAPVATPPDSVTAWTVTPHEAGPVRYGMDVAELRIATGESLPGASVGAACAYVTIATAPPGMVFMLERGRVVRVDVDSAGPATDRGAQVGMSEADVQRRYSDSLTVRPHKYVATGRYLVYVPPAPADFHRVIFETDSQRVRRFRAGVVPAVEYVERCG